MTGARLLFRYRSLEGSSSAYTKSIICENQLFFANPLAFNDPFDCRPVFRLQASNEQIKAYYSGVLKRQAPTLNREERRAEAKRVTTDKDRKLTNPKNLAGGNPFRVSASFFSI